MHSQQEGPQGVGGWLAFMVAGMLVIGPLLRIGRASVYFANAERQYPGLTQVPEWSSFKTVEWVALLVFCAISVYGGLGLAKKRTPDAVSRAKIVLWFNYPISIIVMDILIPMTMLQGGRIYVPTNILSFIVALMFSLIAVGIWTAYLNRSTRVRNTYKLTSSTSLEGTRQVPNTSSRVTTTEGRLQHENKQPHTTLVLFQGGEGDITSIASEQQTAVDEDHIYAAIAKELETGATEKGLWTRLFAECDGDEKQTKVLYIKQRAERLISAERARLERVAQERAAEAARLELIRLMTKKELSDKIQALSATHAALSMLDNVAQNNLQEVSRLLSEEPLLVAVTNSDGDTPLHIAVRNKNQAMARFLLEKGVMTDVKNRYGVTPLEYAENSRQSEMVKLLTAYAKDK